MSDMSTILVIEDDKYISHFIDLSLSKEGYRVVIAQTGDEGMFLFSSYHPSVVLLDLGLPDRDGVDLLRELRTFTDVPVLVVSARGQEAEKIAALENLSVSDEEMNAAFEKICADNNMRAEDLKPYFDNGFITVVQQQLLREKATDLVRRAAHITQ